jgi:hypothetical protein
MLSGLGLRIQVVKRCIILHDILIVLTLDEDVRLQTVRGTMVESWNLAPTSSWTSCSAIEASPDQISRAAAGLA